jgi:hypothetical protein
VTRIVFWDTETTSLAPDADVWDFACIVRDPGQPDREVQFFVHHDPRKAEALPTPFHIDYCARFDADAALSIKRAAQEIHDLTSGAMIVGAVPDFDAVRIARLLRLAELEPGWHYHLQDVENLAVGFLYGFCKFADEAPQEGSTVEVALRRPYDSEVLSRAMDVDPEQFDRHTALGDVRWARALYDAVTGGPS